MRHKHIPSGIILIWIGDDLKIHSESIPADTMKRHLMFPKQYAETQLLCRQLDCLDVEGQVKPMPMTTTGLTRQEAKQAYLREIDELVGSSSS